MNVPTAVGQASTESRDWPKYPLCELPGVAMVTYGVVNAVKHFPNGVPLLRAGDIVAGAIANDDLLRIAEGVHAVNRRSWLDAGDVVVVLVGRVGDAASVGHEQAGWNIARSVGVVKFTAEGRFDQVATWLRGWLKTPTAREWCVRNASGGSAHATLSVAALKRLPVPLPPLERRLRLIEMIDAMERRRRLNTTIAAQAVELADLHFTRALMRHGRMGRTLPLADAAKVVNGIPRNKTAGSGISVGWVAPGEILQCFAPYLDHTAQTAQVAESTACVPGVVLLAPRVREVKTVISRIPVVPGRGAVALRTMSDADNLWLFHEMRSRTRELADAVQGTQGREMSVRALACLKISWPDPDVRQVFGEIASSLHDRAYLALRENGILDEVIASEMSVGAPVPGRTGSARARGQ